MRAKKADRDPGKSFRRRSYCFVRCGGVCYLCGCRLILTRQPPMPPDPREATRDHVIPQSDGRGRGDPENVRICCYACNQIKITRQVSDELVEELKRARAIRESHDSENQSEGERS